jgi:D-inositol-3-phosphate glycosyltransferase
MTILLLNASAADRPARKDRDPGRELVVSGKAFGSSFVKALMTYGSWDRYYFLHGTGESVRSRSRAAPVDRVGFLHTQPREEIVAMDRPVIAAHGPVIQDLRLLRRCYAPRCDWPMTGLIHSIHSKSPPMWILSLVLGDMRPWDALICSSTAGRRVVENYLDTLVDAFPALAGLDPLPRPSLPVIPLGSEALDRDEGRRSTARQRLGAADNDVVLLYVGRFCPKSKCDLVPLLTAFAEVARDPQSHARLVLAGDDTRHNMAAGLRATAAQLGCGDLVTVCPNLTHAEKLDVFCAADVFVSPSDNLQETFGLTITEALSAGLPVIASNWNGYRDLLTEGETGFLVPTYWTDLGPSFDELTLSEGLLEEGGFPATTVVDTGVLRRSIELLVRDAGLRTAMGVNARRVFHERFHWSVVIRQYESLWTELRARAKRDAASSRSVSSRVLGVLRNTFGHYPSEVLADSCEVTMASADRWDALCAAGRGLPGVPFPALVTRTVLDDLASIPCMTIGDLVGRLHTHTGTEFAARLIAARLLKCGILQRVH